MEYEKAEDTMKKNAEAQVADIPVGAGYDRIELDKLRLDARNPRLAELGITPVMNQ